MTTEKSPLLGAVEKALKEKFDMEGPTDTRVPSTARAARPTRVDQLVLPVEERGRMPFTKESMTKRENPQVVQWERVIRQFLRRLSPDHEHRIAAVHVYEWATGLLLADVMREEQRQRDAGEELTGTTWRGDLRKINDLLKEYFGKPYMTWIMGRKIPKAYRVPKGWYVYRHRPKTLTLYAEWRALGDGGM